MFEYLDKISDEGGSGPKPPADLPNYVVDPLHRQSLDQLRTIRSYVDELIAHQEAVAEQDLETEQLADEDEDVVAVEEDSGGTTVIKRVSCGKDSCTTCPHGPYVYEVHREGEDLRWEYKGRADGRDS